MAHDLTLAIWPRRNTPKAALEFYGNLLREFESAPGGDDEYWSLEVLHRHYPEDWGGNSKDPNLPVCEDYESGRAAAEIAKSLESFQGAEYQWKVNGSYEQLEWNHEFNSVEKGWGNVRAKYHGSEFLGDGEHHFSRGAFELSFENVRHFTNSTVRTMPGARTDELRYVSNTGTLFGIFRHLISRLPIEHAAVTVMAEICPVNFHMVFHDRISSFEWDVQKILQLHERGGGYFYEDMRSYSPGPFKLIAYDVGDTYSSVSDVGRSEGEVAGLIQRLDGYSERLGIPDPGTRFLTDGEILETLVECPDIEVGEAGQGIYMIHPGTPFEFLTEPYFRLMERMIGKKGRVLPTVH